MDKDKIELMMKYIKLRDPGPLGTISTLATAIAAYTYVNATLAWGLIGMNVLTSIVVAVKLHRYHELIENELDGTCILDTYGAE